MDAESLTFPSADGTLLAGDLAELSGSLNELSGSLNGGPEPSAVVVACHPHPLYGGDRNNLVPATLARSLPSRGIAVLRFDFRGAGDSAGWHDGGRSERDDVVAAIDVATAAVPGVPVVLVGYSFGADVALAVDDERVAGWCAVAPPLAIYPDPSAYVAGAGQRPVLVASPAHDQFCPPAVAAERTASWVNVELVTIPMADHFLAGAAETVVELVATFVRSSGER